MAHLPFSTTLGDEPTSASWCISATSVGHSGHHTVLLTPEELLRVLRLPAMRLVITELALESELLASDAMRSIRKLFEERKLTWPEIASEVTRLVKHNRNIQRMAQDSSRDNVKIHEIVAQALAKKTLAEALSHVATWDNERSVRQAIRNVGPDNRGETGHGGLWDTTFEFLFKRVLDAWPELAVTRIALRERTDVAESLWQLLDDIDTLSDSMKPMTFVQYQSFYRTALDVARRRHGFLKSDGYKLTWPDGLESYRKSNYTFAEIPEHDPAIYAKYEELRDIVDRALKGEEWATSFPGHAELVSRVTDLRAKKIVTPAPVQMLLFCPMCHTKHIDEGEFATKPHHSHACQGWLVERQPLGGTQQLRRCGHVWRPAIVPTVGVETLPGFLNDPAPAKKNMYPAPRGDIDLGTAAAVQRINLTDPAPTQLLVTLVQDSEFTIDQGLDDVVYWLTIRQDATGGHKVKFTNLNTKGAAGPVIPATAGSGVMLEIYRTGGKFFLQGQRSPVF